MTQYNVQGPDGAPHVIEGPEGATDEEIIGQAQKLFPAAQEAPKFYELEKQPGLPVSQTPTDAPLLDRIKGAAIPLIKQAGRQTLEGLASPMPGSILTTPARVMQENAQQAGADVARGTQDAIGTVPARAAGAAASVALDPTSYLGPEEIFGKKFVPMPDSPGIIKKLVGLFQKGTNPEEIKAGTQSVTDMVKGAKQTFGDALNEAKSKFLPTSVEDKAESVRKYGNIFGFDAQGPLKVPEKLDGSTMPHQLGKVSTPEQLITEIERFKKNVDYIEPADRVKAASYLQDQMLQQGVDFNKSQSSTMGLLKSQYKDLADVIHGADPELAAAKGKMSEAYDAVGNLEKNMKEPGQAEAYLRRIASNPTGKNADALAHLKAVESLTGKETVDDLFNKFKKETGSFTYEELKHPLANIVRKELPKVGQAAVSLAQKQAAPTFTAGKLAKFQPFNTPELQSFRDKLKNQSNAK